MLVRVGKSHHLADVRGYAYEHRLVAESKLGRRLIDGEQIHHIDGDKLNNNPDNIEPVATMADHRLKHRKRDTGRRLPREINQKILCACGCGSKFLKYDNSGRSRKFVSGHNGRIR